MENSTVSSAAPSPSKSSTNVTVTFFAIYLTLTLLPGNTLEPHHNADIGTHTIQQAMQSR
jgi:hypothetical protein